MKIIHYSLIAIYVAVLAALEAPHASMASDALYEESAISAIGLHHLPTRSQNGSRDAELKRVCGWLSAKVV